MDNQVVIVTGGARGVTTGQVRGIGFGVGACFARQGASVVIADLDEAEARAAAEMLNAEGGVNCLGIQCDITEREQVQAMVDRVVETFGRVDVLVNNAGICPFVDIMEMEPEVWHKTIDVILHGSFHCTQIVARKMIERGKGGRIICITSLAEHKAGPAQVDYAAAKSGLRMMMVGFASALGQHGITCNAVAPGMIHTPLTAFHWDKPENVEALQQRVPMGRVGVPEDIGHACVFLASPEAEYISGITLRVDGGHQTICA